MLPWKADMNLRTSWKRRFAVLGVYTFVYLVVHIVQQTQTVHPFLLIIALLVVEIFLGGNSATDRILVAAILYVGAVPVFGWVQTPASVDPLAIVTAYWIVSFLMSSRSLKPSNLVSSLQHLPPLLAGWLSYLWWRDVTHGTPKDVLERFLPVWDFSAHFNFFMMNLTKGAYLNTVTAPDKAFDWAGIEYPTGIHYVWSRFASFQSSTYVNHPDSAIPVFATMVVVTLVLTVFVVGLACARIGSNPVNRFCCGAIGSGIAVGILTVGPLSQSVYAGFVNMPVVLIGFSAILTFHARPLENSTLQLVVVCAGCMALVYNWYPTFLLVAPMVVYQFARTVRLVTWPRIITLGMIAAVSFSLPVQQTLALGVKHLNEQGGVQAPPGGILVAVVVGAFGAALLLWFDRTCGNGYLMGLMPLPLALALALRLRTETDLYPYYFHKASLFILSYSVLAIFFMLISRSVLSTGGLDSQITRRTLRSLGALALGFSLSQSFGYWGLDYPTFSGGNTAAGVLTRNDLVKGSVEFLPTAEIIIREANRVRSLPMKERTCLTLIIPSRLGATDEKFNGPWVGTLSNVWFHALTDSYTTWAMDQAYMTVNVAPAYGNEADLAGLIARTFHPPSVCVLSSRDVNERLREIGPQWQTRDLYGT